MWGIYGTKVPISVVVNIGPGLPTQTEVKQIARRFSWGLSLVNSQPASKRSRSPASDNHGPSRKRTIPRLVEGGEEDSPHESRIRFAEDTQNHQLPSQPHVEEPRHIDTRTTTFGSVSNREISEKLKRKESEIEEDIKKKLKAIYPDDTPAYFRLAPDKSPLGTARNDSSASGLAHKSTAQYLGTYPAMITMEDISRRVSREVLAAAG